MCRVVDRQRTNANTRNRDKSGLKRIYYWNGIHLHLISSHFDYTEVRCSLGQAAGLAYRGDRRLNRVGSPPERLHWFWLKRGLSERGSTTTDRKDHLITSVFICYCAVSNKKKKAGDPWHESRPSPLMEAGGWCPFIFPACWVLKGLELCSGLG
jgi:hypothetical protein